MPLSLHTEQRKTTDPWKTSYLLFSRQCFSHSHSLNQQNGTSRGRQIWTGGPKPGPARNWCANKTNQSTTLPWHISFLVVNETPSLGKLPQDSYSSYTRDTAFVKCYSSCISCMRSPQTISAKSASVCPNVQQDCAQQAFVESCKENFDLQPTAAPESTSLMLLQKWQCKDAEPNLATLQ